MSSEGLQLSRGKKTHPHLQQRAVNLAHPHAVYRALFGGHMTRLACLLLLTGCFTNAPSEPPAPTATEGRRVQIDISSAGYTPSAVTATAGEDLTLVFLREDAANCGETVLFPDNPEVAKVEVPVGTEVAVNLKAPASGELTFTCGMAMYKGAIVVGS